MTHYLWVYLLSALAILSLIGFLVSFSKDHLLIKKLKLSKFNYLLNFSLLLMSFLDIGLIIYLFSTLKEQINVLS